MRTSFIYYPSLKFLLLVPKYRHQKIDIVTRILKLQLRLYPLFIVLVKLLGTQVNYRIGHPQKTVAELFHVLPERLVKGQALNAQLVVFCILEPISAQALFYVQLDELCGLFVEDGPAILHLLVEIERIELYPIPQYLLYIVVDILVLRLELERLFCCKGMKLLNEIGMGTQTTVDQSQLLGEQLIIQQSKPTSHGSYQVLPRLYPFRNKGMVIDNVLYLIFYIPLIVIIK